MKRNSKGFASVSFLMLTAWAIFGIILGIAWLTQPVSEIKPVTIPAQTPIVVDVVTRELDLVQITSHWPGSLEVRNTSEDVITGFDIEVFAANDDGGPISYVRWGNAGAIVGTFRLNPNASVTVPIKPHLVERFQENGKPFLYIQMGRVWVNNNLDMAYVYGIPFAKDPSNPKQFNVTKTAKEMREAKKIQHRMQHNHAVGIFHITHSVQPPFFLGCCTHTQINWVNVDCYNSQYPPAPIIDPCGDPYGQVYCYVISYGYSFDNQCSVSKQANGLSECISHNPYCEYSCGAHYPATYSVPCNCCNCG